MTTYMHSLHFMKTILCVAMIAACSLCASSGVQAQDPKMAEMAFDDGNYFKAIELYEKLERRNPSKFEYYYPLGVSYLKTNIDPLRALDYLLEAERQPKFPVAGLLDIAQAHAFHLQYDEALRTLQKYEELGNVNKKNIQEFERLKANYESANNLLRHPVNVSFSNLGSKLNSEYADYHPFVDKDEKLMMFTSRRKSKPGAQPEFDGYFPSNIYMSTRENGEWTEAFKLSDRINTNYDEQTVGLTDTGDTLFFYIDHINSFGNIYISERVNNVFTDPSALKNTVNTEHVESACSISRDASVLIFSSERPGGFGGLDIWMRRKLPDGQWGDPLNLGTEINTPFDEDFPTLSGDGHTLYFSSNGHPGMGNFDLFFSTWDELGKLWSKPQNLGYPINTPANEKSISFNAAGDHAYLTALRPDGKGDLDLYMINYLEVDKTMPAIFLLDIPEITKVQLPNHSKIIVTNELDQMIGEYAPNNITGQYVMALYPGKYFIKLDMPGYLPYDEMIVVNNAHVRQEKNLRTIQLEK
jgi:hypothetical protein